MNIYNTQTHTHAHARTHTHTPTHIGHPAAVCGVLVPQPGTEPGPTSVKAPSPNYWTAREFPRVYMTFIESNFRTKVKKLSKIMKKNPSKLHNSKLYVPIL